MLQNHNTFLKRYISRTSFYLSPSTLALSPAVWNGAVPRLPPGSFQPPQPQRHPAHHPQAAAVRRPGRPARGRALHSLPTACGETVRREREQRVGPSPVLPGGVWIVQLRDGGCVPVASVPLSELVWERAVLAAAVGFGALPEDMSQQVWWGLGGYVTSDNFLKLYFQSLGLVSVGFTFYSPSESADTPLQQAKEISRFNETGSKTEYNHTWNVCNDPPHKKNTCMYNYGKKRGSECNQKDVKLTWEFVRSKGC